MKEKKDKKSKKRKNGIWFNNTETIDNFAVQSAKNVEKTIENIIFYSIVIPLQILQTAGVFAIAIYNNAFVELSFFLVGFFFTRSFLGETFHLHSTLGCCMFTWSLFFLITKLIPSVYISVFLCVILGTILALYMHYIVVKDEVKCHED